MEKGKEEGVTSELDSRQIRLGVDDQGQSHVTATMLEANNRLKKM